MRHLLCLPLLALIGLAACQVTTSGGDGGAAGSGGSPGTSTTSAGPVKEGTVTVFCSPAANTPTCALSAVFFGHPGAVPCQPQLEEGSCTLSTCPLGGGASEPPPTAGDITVTASNQTATLSPDTDKMYTGLTGQVTLLAPGDVVQVQASGAEIPAFALSAAAPASVEVTSPLLSETTVLDVDGTKDLVVTWTGSSADKVAVGTTAVDAAADEIVSLHCEFDASQGQGAVPSSLLQKLPKVPKMGMGMGVHNTAKVEGNGYAVTLSLATDAMMGGKVALGWIAIE